MNIRKEIDYKRMYAELDSLLCKKLMQVELYYQIGRVICQRPEKGAAVAASEYLRTVRPDDSGFSPRNMRRMRAFYSAYGADQELAKQALTLGWTQNMVILESCEPEQKTWYIKAAIRYGWSKNELLSKISENAHTEVLLDEKTDSCYTESEETSSEETHVQNSFYLPRQDFTFIDKSA